MRAYAALGLGALCIAFAPIFVKWADAAGGVIALYRIGVATVVLTPLFLRRYHGVLRRVRPRLVAISMLGGALSGAVLIMGDDFFRGVSLGQGDLLALGAALFYSAYILVTKRARDRLATLFYIWLANLGAVLTLIALTLSTGGSITGYSPSTYAAMIAQGLVSQVIGVSAIAWATGHLPASFVSVGLLSQPVMAAILAYFLLGEGFTPLQVMGGVLVLSGIYLAATEQRRRPAAVREQPAYEG